MDITITAIAIAFLTMLGMAVLLFLKDEPIARPPKNILEPVIKKEDQAFALQKKVINLEQEIKELACNLQNSQTELEQSREREKKITNERSQISFDTQQYEKFKGEHAALKENLETKEESLEKEITLRRQQSTELIQTRQDFDKIKQRAIEAEDDFRKSQTIIETLTKELKETKKRLDEQQKVVNLHHENKIEGDWVSRVEFENVEKELKEKEAMIQKLLSLKKDT